LMILAYQFLRRLLTTVCLPQFVKKYESF
jgi:hypothetical protein